jgi:hypothetical protein
MNFLGGTARLLLAAAIVAAALGLIAYAAHLDAVRSLGLVPLS